MQSGSRRIDEHAVARTDVACEPLLEIYAAIALADPTRVQDAEQRLAFFFAERRHAERQKRRPRRTFGPVSGGNHATMLSGGQGVTFGLPPALGDQRVVLHVVTIGKHYG